MNRRDQNLQALARHPEFDVLVLGAGVNGAFVYDALCRQGFRTLLVDPGDFASGTSQASGLMLWGGLLYLQQGHLAAVIELSAERDRLLREREAALAPIGVRYLPSHERLLTRIRLQSGLGLYWLLGGCRRRRPRRERSFPEQPWLAARPGASYLVEEGLLRGSDCRFALEAVLPHQPPQGIALNHVSIAAAPEYRQGLWRVPLRERFSGQDFNPGCRLVVNCGGPWADNINQVFQVSSPYRHVLSQGVYLGLRRRPEHQSYLVLDQHQCRDVITLVPWGPVSLWGPTERYVDSPEDGLQIRPEDLAWLGRQYRHHFSIPLSADDLVSLRVGVRPLVMDADAERPAYPLDVSRRQAVHFDREHGFILCYGGKLTNAGAMAAKVLSYLATARRSGTASPGRAPTAERMELRLDGLSLEVVQPAYSRDQEFCCTLEDYLRRRTNISQWVPRLGLGRDGCARALLESIAAEFSGSAGQSPLEMVQALERRAACEFDALIHPSLWQEVL